MALTSISYQIFQKPGHRRILFTAIDHVANEHIFGPVITFDNAYDPETVKEAIRQRMETQLGEREVDEWLQDNDVPITIVHATKAQYAAAIRAAFKDATKEEAWRIAFKIYSRFQAGDFTAQQLATAFGVTVAELNTFATNVLIPAHDNYLALQAAEGQ